MILFGFTPQEYMVFEELLKKAEKVTVAITTDNFEVGSKELDLFYFNKIFANKLIDIAKKNSKKVELDFCEENLRIKSNELRFLEEVLSSKFKVYSEKPKDINLFLANNSYSEMEYIAVEILNLVKNYNYKYNEIAVITNNLEEYALDSKVIFDKYNIPIFIDEKKDLNQNILIRYILALLDIFAKNWSFESIFNFLKLGMLDISNYDIFALENYCKKWGIKYNKWFKEFCYEEINEEQTKLEILRKQIVEPIIKLKEDISKNKTVKDITKCLYDFLIQNHINEILDNKIKEIGSQEINNEYNTSYKILVQVLDDIVFIFGDEKIDFEKYRDLLQIGFSQSELGRIPMSQDQVVLGDSKRSRNSNIKVSFICGVNDGFFPTINNFEGFLNDNDRELLKESGMEIAKTSIELLYEGNFEIYNILSMASDKLYISYTSTDKEGKSVRPSILIKKIKRIFPELVENSDIISKKYYITNKTATFDDSISVYREALDGIEPSDEWKTAINYYKITDTNKFEKALQGINYTNEAEYISKENIQKLYGNNLKTSVSRLEQYRRCPFSFHLKYGLKLKENPELKIQTVDTGSFMHEIIDDFFEVIEGEKIDIKNITKEQIEDIVKKLIDETLEMSKYYVFTSTAKFRSLTRRLKKVVSESIEFIVYSIQNSKFDVLGHEIDFGEKGKYKPIEIELDDNKKLEITGKIDRVDIGKLDDKTYVRIIDYKSSVKNLDLNQVVAGLQIQLITYLDAISKQDNFDPSGVLYFGLVDNIVKSDKNMDDEKIKEEIRKKFRMNGLVLANINVIKMMDTSLNEGASSIIPVTLKKDGEISESKSSSIKEDEFEKLQEQVKDVIKQIGNEILSGKIDINPYNYNNHTGCDYCEYKSICNFNPNLKNNKYNYIRKVN